LAKEESATSPPDSPSRAAGGTAERPEELRQVRTIISPRRLVRVLLYDEPTTMNEVMVQFGSYQTLMQNKELQSLIQKLYYDAEKKRIKRGAGGKEAGTPRRLMDFFRQIELNYDLRSISESRFWDMLPVEFAKFKN
jgi:hypothetical protein